MSPKFIYFDLGRVLVDFDLDRMVVQMAEVADVEPQTMYSALFESGLELDYELGRVSTDDFFAKNLRDSRATTGPPAAGACLQRHVHRHASNAKNGRLAP